MPDKDSGIQTQCGYIAIIGRPNVGKSTLLNRIVGEKISITSRKPQTTRHQLLGIKTAANIQALYVDTPGIHGNEPRAINRYMNRAARSVLRDVDVVIFVVDRMEWNKDDQIVADALKNSRARTILAVNKIDLIDRKARLLPRLEQLQAQFPDADIVPVSATSGHNLDTLERLVLESLPPGPFLFPDSQITDRSERFLVSELIREKMMRQLGDELPYALTVQIEQFEEGETLVNIDAVALVERESQKAILIGKGGEKIKRVGSDARKDIEMLLGRKVMLRLWVKTRSGWSDDDRGLTSLGYDDV
ncbi:MAG: GTPase Era [Pseudomonadales bacterium]